MMAKQELLCAIDRVYKEHEIEAGSTSIKSWKIKNPKMGSTYSFTVAWIPGVLIITGDIGEHIYTHYHAMGRSWEDAVEWVRNSDLQYLLEKSKADKTYDYETTVLHLIALADQQQTDGSDITVWKLIFEFMADRSIYEHCYTIQENYDWAMEWYKKQSRPFKPLWYKNKADQSVVIKHMKKNQEQFDSTASMKLTDHDYFGSEKYTEQSIWGTKALMLWANLLGEELAEPHEVKKVS